MCVTSLVSIWISPWVKMIEILIAAYCLADVRDIALDIAWHESRYDIMAYNDSGDYGVMQINHRTWEDTFGIDNPEWLFQADYNVAIGCRILNHLHEKYAKNDVFWWTRYHSFKEHRRERYKKRVLRDKEGVR